MTRCTVASEKKSEAQSGEGWRASARARGRSTHQHRKGNNEGFATVPDGVSELSRASLDESEGQNTRGDSPEKRRHSDTTLPLLWLWSGRGSVRISIHRKSADLQAVRASDRGGIPGTVGSKGRRTARFRSGTRSDQRKAGNPLQRASAAIVTPQPGLRSRPSERWGTACPDSFEP